MRKLALSLGIATIVASQAFVVVPGAAAIPPTPLTFAMHQIASVLASQQTHPIKIEQDVLDAYSRGQAPDVLIHFDAPADLSGAHAIRASDRAARGQWVMDTLRSHANASQADAVSLLRSLGRKESFLDDPEGYYALWINNTIAVKGLKSNELSALSSARGVRGITLQREISPPELETSPADSSARG